VGRSRRKRKSANAFAIPKRIPLPGWPVTVKLVDQSVLDEYATDLDAWFDYTNKGAEILILKNLPLVQQRACLAHELQHAVIDYLDVLVNAGVAELSYRKKGG
jgi:hypothetical protein